MSNKTVVITGGARGIGRSASKLFAAKGYNVLINYNTSESAANKLKDSLTNKNYNVEIYKADIKNRVEVDAMFDYAIDKFSTIDILINNAGIAQSKMFQDISENDWNLMMDTNLKGTFNTTQSCLKYLVPQKSGSIINISSMWGQVGASCEVHYSVAKAGIIGLTKALAKELGPSKIRVNAIAPGVIQTDMLNDFSADDLEDLKNETPLMELGTCTDIAESLLFLASENSKFITGQILGVNGGYVI